MPAHPTRKSNRRRGSGLAREPFAFGSIPLSENPNRGKYDAGTLGYHGRQPGLAATIARFERPELFPSEHTTFPGRDSLGRRNPRMPRRSHA